MLLLPQGGARRGGEPGRRGHRGPVLRRGGCVGGGGGGGLAAVVVAALDGDEAGGVGEEPLGAVAHPLRLLLVDLQTDQLDQRLVENPEIVQY